MENLGSVRVSPSVLATIACLTALEVPGVARMSDDLVSGVNRLIGRPGSTTGVKVQIREGTVLVALYVVARSGYSLLEVGSHIQGQVAEALSRMVGMSVAEVNVFIRDVE